MLKAQSDRRYTYREWLYRQVWLLLAVMPLVSCSRTPYIYGIDRPEGVWDSSDIAPITVGILPDEHPKAIEVELGFDNRIEVSTLAMELSLVRSGRIVATDTMHYILSTQPRRWVHQGVVLHRATAESPLATEMREPGLYRLELRPIYPDSLQGLLTIRLQIR